MEGQGTMGADGTIGSSPRMSSSRHPSWPPLGRTGTRSGPPMRTDRSSSCHPPRSLSNPHRSSCSRLPLRHPGTIARTPQATTRMFNSVPEDGDRWPRRRRRRNPSEIHRPHVQPCHPQSIPSPIPAGFFLFNPFRSPPCPSLLLVDTCSHFHYTHANFLLLACARLARWVQQRRLHGVYGERREAACDAWQGWR